jgi:hypothetical protein
MVQKAGSIEGSLVPPAWETARWAAYGSQSENRGELGQTLGCRQEATVEPVNGTLLRISVAGSAC